MKTSSEKSQPKKSDVRIDLDFTSSDLKPRIGYFLNTLARYAEEHFLPLFKEHINSFEELYIKLAPTLKGSPSNLQVAAVIQQLFSNFAQSVSPDISEMFLEVLKLSREQVVLQLVKPRPDEGGVGVLR